MWQLRYKTDELLERGGPKRKERGTNHKRLLMIENKQWVDGGRWMEDGPDG